MQLKKLPLTLVSIASALCSISAFAQLPPDVKSDLGPDVPAFRVRPGYRVTRVVSNDTIKAIRFIEFSKDGKTLYLSDRENGAIYALRDPDENGTYKTVTTFVKGKPTVQGMNVHGDDGWLYFSQAGEGSVSRARDTNGDGVADDVETVVAPKTLPVGGGHPFEGLLVTDDAIYATASDPQNMTPDPNRDVNADPSTSDRKTIYMFDLDGKNKRIFCTGIRNTEKLRFRPGTSEIWGFDHGSDNFGGTYGEKQGHQPVTDVNPNEELNHYVQDGFYGHPFITGSGIPRPEFAKRADIIQLAEQTIAPEWLVHAHWAVNGWTFLNSDYFGDSLGAKGDIFFCSHGSWNSTKPVGSCVQRVMFDQLTGKPCGSMTIVDCAAPAGARRNRLSRPCDAAEAPDGTILFSSDEPAGLFRISKSGR